MEKKRVEAARGGEACRFKLVDESYRRKPIGRASISSNSAAASIARLFSHQRNNTYRRIQQRNRVRVKYVARAAHIGEISAHSCVRTGSVWQRACTEQSRQPLRNSAAFLFPRHAGQGRTTFSPDPLPTANTNFLLISI